MKYYPVVALTHGNGAGSKVFQSFLDNHPDIISIAGYPLMYFYPHWMEWMRTESTWEGIVNKLFDNHPSLLDSREMPGSETLDKLGDSENEFIQNDRELFRTLLLSQLSDSVISSGRFLQAVHIAYAQLRGHNLDCKKCIMYHIHDPFFVKYLYKDFPDLKVISMVRDVRGNIYKRVRNSIDRPNRIRLNDTDYFLAKSRSYKNAVRHLTCGLDEISYIPIEKQRVVAHEDLLVRFDEVMANISHFMKISYNDSMRESTFDGKSWNSTYYDFDKSFKVNPSILSDEWRNNLGIFEWFWLEGLNYDYNNKYGYTADYYNKESWFNRLLLFLSIFLPVKEETHSFLRFFKLRNFVDYIKSSNFEANNYQNIKKYKGHAFYKHKTHHRGYRLYKKLKHRVFIALKSRGFENIAIYSYNIISIIEYILGPFIQAKEIFHRYYLCWSAFFRRMRRKRSLPAKA